MKLIAFFLLALSVTVRAELFVSSFNTNAVYRFDEDSGALLGAGAFIASGSGSLSLPHRLLISADGTVLVASAGNNRILRYAADGSFLSTFVQPNTNGLGTQLDYPVDMVIGPDGALYVTSQLSDSVLRFNATTGAFLGTFVSVGSGGLDGPSGLEFFGGDLYVVGRFSNAVHRYNGTTGAPIGGGSFATTGLSQPFGLEWGADGNLYVASGNTNSVVRFNNAGTSLGNFVSGGGTSVPIDLAFGPNAGLYVASFNSNSVIKFNATTGASLGNFVAAASGGLNGPNFITFRPVPEAGSAAQGLAGALVLLRRRRRK